MTDTDFEEFRTPYSSTDFEEAVYRTTTQKSRLTGMNFEVNGTAFIAVCTPYSRLEFLGGEMKVQSQVWTEQAQKSRRYFLTVEDTV